jgi:hypothetical protein
MSGLLDIFEAILAPPQSSRKSSERQAPAEQAGGYVSLDPSHPKTLNSPECVSKQ